VIEPLRMSFEVSCPVDHAFDVWTSKIARWWPADHSVSGENGLLVVLEADATEVEIRFIDQGNATTRVEIEHRGWERLGARGASWRDANRGGWSTLLPHYVAAI